MIRARSSDGVIHQFPDNTPQTIVDSTMKRYARESGTLGTLGAMGRGLVASTLGSAMVPTPIDAQYGMAKTQGGIPYAGTQTLEKILPKPELGQIHPTAQTVGELLPVIGAGADLAAAKIAATAPKLTKYAPRAMRRAESTIVKIGPVSDIKMSKLGDAMMDELRGKFDRLVHSRAAAADAAEARLSGFWRNNPEAVQVARKKAFKEASRDVNNFNQKNALGKQIAGNLSPYSDVPKIAHSSVPGNAFKDAQRVRDLRELLGGDQRQVERYASEYAATNLQSAVDAVKPPIGKPRLPGSTISNMAKAAEKWRDANTGWLDETPLTKVSVDYSIDQLKAAAKAASHLRGSVVGSAALIALYEMGANAGYWIRWAASHM